VTYAYRPFATLNLTTIVINDNGGTLVESDFNFLRDGIYYMTPGIHTVPEGVYEISSIPVFGYNINISCTEYVSPCGSNSSCTVNAICGSMVQCVAIADDISPVICLDKNLTNVHLFSSSLTEANFTLTLIESHMTTISGYDYFCSPSNFHAGVFTVTEQYHANYTTLGIRCYNNVTGANVNVHGYQNTSLGQIYVGLNETVICVIYNTHTLRPSKLEVVKRYYNGYERNVCEPAFFLNGSPFPRNTPTEMTPNTTVLLTEAPCCGFEISDIYCALRNPLSYWWSVPTSSLWISSATNWTPRTWTWTTTGTTLWHNANDRDGNAHNDSFSLFIVPEAHFICRFINSAIPCGANLTTTKVVHNIIGNLNSTDFGITPSGVYARSCNDESVLTISENSVPNYVLDSIVCWEGMSVIANVSYNNLELDITDPLNCGLKVISCTITNHDYIALQIFKQTINGLTSYSSLPPNEFQIYVNGSAVPLYISGPNLAYSDVTEYRGKKVIISENGSPHYIAYNLTCNNGATVIRTTTATSWASSAYDNAWTVEFMNLGVTECYLVNQEVECMQDVRPRPHSYSHSNPDSNSCS
jgi:hypothetical protein